MKQISFIDVVKSTVNAKPGFNPFIFVKFHHLKVNITEQTAANEYFVC